MAQFLKQSTAGTLIMFGPFVDKTDGVTLETGAGIITSIDHATTGIFLSKNGAAAAIRHQGVTASVLDAYGMFKVTLDATDTNTVGTLDVLMAEAATFLPVHKSFMVLPANVYDSLMGTDLLDVNAAQWLGTAILAPGTAGTPDVNAKLIGGTAQTGNDVGGDVNEILVDTAVIGALGAGLTAIPWNVAWDAEVQSEATDALNAYDPPTRAEATTDKDAVITEVNANETKIDTVDTVVDAVKLQTDKLVFTVANRVDANALQVGDKTGYALSVTPPTAAQIQAEMEENGASLLDSINDRLPSDPADESLLEAAIAALPTDADVNAACDTALADYDPPTKGELDTAQTALKTEIDANETKIDTVDGVVDAIKLKTDNLPSDPADESLLEAAIAAVTAPSVGDIDTQLSLTHGSGSWEDRRHVPL